MLLFSDLALLTHFLLFRFYIEQEKLQRQLNVAEDGYKQGWFHLQDDIANIINQMNRLKQHCYSRNTSIKEQFGHVEALGEEIPSVLDKTSWTQQTDQLLIPGKTNLAQTLEYTSEKMMILEIKQKDQDHIVRTQEKDIEELRACNHHFLDMLRQCQGVHHHLLLVGYHCFLR